MKTILVTGGAGLIGEALCKRLLDGGNRVICVDNFITSSKANIKDLSKNPNFVLIEDDITNNISELLDKKRIKVSEIYHLACPTGVPNIAKMPFEMLRTSSIGTEKILNIALKHKAQFLFTSSSEIYGDPLVFPQKEDYAGNADPTGPSSQYEEGKRFAESLILSYVRKLGLDAKIVRLFNTYGPKRYEDLRVTTKFLKFAKANKPIPVEGDGSQKRTFCYVDDLVEALILIMKKGKRGEVYNAGSDTQVSILELANLVKFATNSKSSIKFVKRPAHDHQARLPDLTKLKSLGWRQNIGIYEGLKKTAI